MNSFSYALPQLEFCGCYFCTNLCKSELVLEFGSNVNWERPKQGSVWICQNLHSKGRFYHILKGFDVVKYFLFSVPFDLFFCIQSHFHTWAQYCLKSMEIFRVVHHYWSQMRQIEDMTDKEGKYNQSDNEKPVNLLIEKCSVSTLYTVHWNSAEQNSQKKNWKQI